jgi:O-antigen/teichoic acid export membrane protein
VVSGATTVWLAALGLITTPYMLHRLGVNAYAIFALVSLVTGYLGNLELGFGHATLRFLARAHAEGDDESEAKIIGTSLWMFLSAAAVGAALALTLAPVIVKRFADFPPGLENMAIGSLRLGAIIIILAFLNSFASVSLQALGRFRIMLGMRVVTGTLMSIAAVTMAAIYDDVRAVLLAQVVISTGACLFLFVKLATATTARLRPHFDRPMFRAMLGYGALVLVTGIAYQILMQGPPTVLAGVARAAQLTAFAVPAIVLQQMTLLVAAASTGFVPFASAESRHDDTSRLAAVFRSNLRITLLLMGPIAGFLIVFAYPLLAAWVGNGFAHAAADPLKLLSAAGLFIALGAPAADVSRGLNRLRWILVYASTAAVIAVGSAIVLADKHGAKGAATALLLGTAITTLPFIPLAAKHLLGIGPGQLARSIGPPAAAAALTCALYVAGSHVTAGFGGALLVGFVVTTLHVALAYRFVLDERERDTLRAGAKRAR